MTYSCVQSGYYSGDNNYPKSIFYLLNLVWHRGVHQSEKEVPQWPGLPAQNTCCYAPRQGQRQMIGQKPKAQLEEVVMLPSNKYIFFF